MKSFKRLTLALGIVAAVIILPACGKKKDSQDASGIGGISNGIVVPNPGGSNAGGGNCVAANPSGAVTTFFAGQGTILATGFTGQATVGNNSQGGNYYYKDYANIGDKVELWLSGVMNQQTNFTSRLTLSPLTSQALFAYGPNPLVCQILFGDQYGPVGTPPGGGQMYGNIWLYVVTQMSQNGFWFKL